MNARIQNSLHVYQELIHSVESKHEPRWSLWDNVVRCLSLKKSKGGSSPLGWDEIRIDIDLCIMGRCNNG